MITKAEKLLQIQRQVAHLGLSARAIARGTALMPNTVTAVLRGEQTLQERTVNLVWFFLGFGHEQNANKKSLTTLEPDPKEPA